MDEPEEIKSLMDHLYGEFKASGSPDTSEGFRDFCANWMKANSVVARSVADGGDVLVFQGGLQVRWAADEKDKGLPRRGVSVTGPGTYSEGHEKSTHKASY